MDHFGIGQAMQGMAHAYFQTSRRTGRTTSLLDSLKDGDRVCFATRQEANIFRQRCQQRGLEVECMVVNPADPHRLMERGRATGRTVFDHTWVEQFYLAALEQCARDIDELQAKASSDHEARRETERCTVEMARWRV